MPDVGGNPLLVSDDLQINSDLGLIPAPSTKKKPHRSFGPRCGKAGYRVQGSSAYMMTPEYICFKTETVAAILVRRDNALLWVDRAITVTGRLTTKTRAGASPKCQQSGATIGPLAAAGTIEDAGARRPQVSGHCVYLRFIMKSQPSGGGLAGF